MRKKEVMKKALSILLAFGMVLSCVPTTAFAVTTDNLCEHHEVHTAEVCGYVEGEADCTYHCEVCHVQELVDTLPESVTAENSETVAAQLTAIDTEKASLSDEEMTQVDFAKYTAAAEALGSVYDAVPADTGYYAGGIVGSQEGAEITNASNSGIVNGGDTTGDTTEAIQIFIKKPDGTTLTLEVAPDATVNSIKETIQEKCGYPTANQTLIYNGQQLIDGSKTLTDYSIISGAAIQLMVRWNVTIAGTTNGTVTADKATATEGATVTLTIAPNEGYELDALTVTYGDDNTAVIVAEDNTFTMPAGDVTVTATFKAKAPELVETNTIYFDNSVFLWSTVYAYAWESETGTRCLGTWPGTVMTLVEGETSIYSVAVSAGADTIIFNNGSEQTGDQPLGTGNCFKAEETNADGKYIGSWYTYPCTHADGSYTDNLDGTHSGTCTACGSILAENEVHTLDETGKCVCGLQAVAKVGDTFYLTLKDALTAVESSTSVDTVVTLLADVTSYNAVLKGIFTLDLNGKTITANDMNALEICNADTNIIIIDGAGGGTINGGELSQGTAAIAVRVYGGAKLTIRGGTFTGTYGVRVGVTGISGAASVVIEDGTFLASDAALYVENSQDSAIVQGGSFIGDDCAIVNWGTLTVTGAPILTIKNGYAPIRYCGGSLDLSSAKCGGWIIANSSGNDLTVEEELLIPEGHDVYEPGTTNQLTAIGAYGMGEISDHIHVDHEEDGDHICDVSGCGNVSSGHTYDSDGKCTECGEPAAMLLTFADDSTLYTSDVESLMGDTDDKSQNDITCIQLLRDVNLKDGLLVFSTVLDLNDFALTGVGVASMGDLTITGPGSITGGMAAVGAAGKLTILGSPTLTAAGMEGVPYATIGYCGSQIDLSKCTGYNGWTVINLDMNEDQMPVSNILLSAHGSVEDAQGNLLTAGAAVEYEGIVTLRESTCTALGHKDENWKDPTCTEWGSYDDVAYCSECEAEVSRTTVPIPATGHDWDEPAYQWNAAYTTCTATRVCENDETHVESVIATTIESNMTVAATCTDEGQMTYTATFAEDWAPEVIEYDSIPVIAHSEEYDYTNNGDGTHDVNYLCHVGVKEANVPHTYTEGRCVCGIQVAASVTTAEGTTYYIKFDDAFTAAQARTGSTLTLLADVTGSYYVESGTFTLDLNGRTITGTGSYGLYIAGYVDLTITDSSAAGKGGAVVGTTYGVEKLGTLTVTGSAQLKFTDESGATIRTVGGVDLKAAGCNGWTIKNNSSASATGEHYLIPDGYVLYVVDEVTGLEKVMETLGSSDICTIRDHIHEDDAADRDHNCDICGVLASNHSYGADNTCTECGVGSGVLVTYGDGHTEKKKSVREALADDSDIAGAADNVVSVQLLCDVTVSSFDEDAIFVLDGTVTLDLNGYSVTASGTYEDEIVIYTVGDLTITDSSAAQTGTVSPLLFQFAGNLTIEGEPRIEMLACGNSEGNPLSLNLSKATFERLDIWAVGSLSESLITGSYGLFDEDGNRVTSMEEGATGTIRKLHTHSWIYSAFSDIITATCKGTIGECDVKTATIKVAAPTGSLVYDGQVKTATTTGFIDGVDTPVIIYTGDCKSVGTHYASIKLGDAEAKVSFEITPATPTIAWSDTTASVDYTGKAAVITAPAVTLVNNETYSGTIYYSYTGTSSGTGLPTNAGTYTITASIAAQGNYTAATSSNTLELTIEKKEIAISGMSWTVPTGAVYSGTAYTATLSGDLPEGVKVTVTGNTGINAGSYTAKAVFALADGFSADNYEIVNGEDLIEEWSIAKKSVTVSAKEQTITYGETISDTEVTSTGLVDGHSVTVTLIPSITNITVNGTITASAAVITADGTDVTANYSVRYISGKLVIEPDTSKIDKLTTENVTSANEEDIKAVQVMMATAETEGIDEATAAQWAAITANCEELIERIKAVEAENARIAEAAADFDLNTVKSTDKAELEQLAQDIESLLDTQNLTEDERFALETVLEQVEGMIDTINETAEDSKAATDTIGALDTESVTSNDKDELEQAIVTIDKLLQAEHLTEEERTALEDAKADAEALIAVIDAAQDATDTENTEKVEDVTSENVKPDDKEALEDAKADLEKALEDNIGNYTEEEKQTIQDEIQRIEDAIEALENVEDVTEAITQLPETVALDDEEAAEKIFDAKKAYDELTDHEKSLVDETTKEKLDSLVDTLTAYDIIKGDGGKWTKGSSYGLSFTANGPFSKFFGIEVDGKEVASTYYTAESGSTIITLKQSFLKRLSTGEHTITVLYTDGETSGTFKILAQSTSPATGDDSNIMLWSGMLCVSTLGLVVLLADRKRRRSIK